MAYNWTKEKYSITKINTDAAFNMSAFNINVNDSIINKKADELIQKVDAAYTKAKNAFNDLGKEFEYAAKKHAKKDSGMEKNLKNIAQKFYDQAKNIGDKQTKLSTLSDRSKTHQANDAALAALALNDDLSDDGEQTSSGTIAGSYFLTDAQKQSYVTKGEKLSRVEQEQAAQEFVKKYGKNGTAAIDVSRMSEKEKENYNLALANAEALGINPETGELLTDFTNADGTKITRNTLDNSLTVSYKNGDVLIDRANGSQKMTYANKDVLEVNTDGSSFLQRTDGSSLQKNIDGTMLETTIDKTTIKTEVDGTKFYTYTNNTTLKKNTDGSSIFTAANGDVTAIAVDGSRTVTYKADNSVKKFDVLGNEIKEK